ncbi:hypothetical protein [Reyranella soli]|nr:hypothetical protein [Reyranella soli]
MGDYFPHDPGAERVEFMEDLESERSMRPVKLERAKLGAANKKKIYVVCDRCNSGWMSRLEKATKPTLVQLITGVPTLLDDAAVQRLVNFVALKAMVAEHDVFKGRTPMPIYDSAARRRFMDTGIAPDGIRMWIGAGGGPKWRTGFYRFVSGVRLIKAPLGATVEPNFVRSGANIHSVTWGLGSCFFHVVATTNMEFYRQHGWDVPPGLFAIWPLQAGTLVWPPNFAFTDWAIDELSVSLRGLSKTFHKVASDGTLLPP